MKICLLVDGVRNRGHSKSAMRHRRPIVANPTMTSKRTTNWEDGDDAATPLRAQHYYNTNNNNDGSERQSCPCKRVNLSLSSLTAAEYGDVPALAKRQRRQQGLGESANSRRSSSFEQQHTSPLHLAAQHGHIAATAWLLQQQQGLLRNDWFQGGATPLHRASFSGAVGTMRLLLDASKMTMTRPLSSSSSAMAGTMAADSVPSIRRILLAQDTSFGDNMTALHKAVAGGRYLAVQLLLDFMLYFSNSKGEDEDDLREAALKAVDAQGRTPRELAVELRRQQWQANLNSNVTRWNVVAGGLPDWDKCVQLLRTAEFRLRASPSARIPAPAGHSTNSFPSQNSLHQGLPFHFSMSGDATCIDCRNTSNGGPCLTASWEQEFRESLEGVVDSSLTTSDPIHNNGNMSSPFDPVSMQVEPPGENKAMMENSKKSASEINSDELSLAYLGSALEDESSLGDLCGKCQQKSIVLYRRGGLLVCKRCRRR